MSATSPNSSEIEELDHPTAAPVRLLPRKEVLRLIGVSSTTLMQWVKAGDFPEPRVLNPSARYPRIAWRQDQVTAWINALQPGRGRGPAVAIYARITAKAEQRRSGAEASARERSGASSEARERKIAGAGGIEGPRVSTGTNTQRRVAPLGAIPEPAQPRPVLLPRSERRRA
jgi:predicted DNA-binding transcriptional regulator AlpA